jgi:RNA polymerase sigma-70 factor (ECF subfamily)
MNFAGDHIILELISKPESRNDGYRQLIGKYKEKLYWHIRRLVQCHEDTDDVLQNTFLKIVKNIDGFKQQSSLYTWIYRIATNESINFINNKKNKNAESNQNIVNNSQAYLITDTFNEDRVLSTLASAINLLPEKQKLVFNLRYYDEMSYQDMSIITKTSVGALKASYHHAVKKIEEFIKTEI